MKSDVFVRKATDIAKNCKTLYVMGAFGARLYPKNKKRYTTNHDYNRRADRTKRINAASIDTFAFDCCGLIKGILWGWSGKTSPLFNYGGAAYGSNGVPDYGADRIITECADVSTDFSTIQPGEAVWMKGHIGIYIGGGLAVESTPSWADGVQITAVANLGKKLAYPARKWTKHGKLPWVEYPDTEKEEETYDMKVRTLKKGSKGEDVRALQFILIGRGFSCGSSGADGSFGPATDSAVRKAQLTYRLEVDGVVGPNTYKALWGL